MTPSISEEELFTMVGSTMLYHDQTKSSYDDAKSSCAGYGAQLVEILNEQEWDEVKS